MNDIEKVTVQSLLLDKGIILQSGAICHDKINLISGAMTAPLIEMVWTFSNYDIKTMERISTIFTYLYNEGHEPEMLTVLHILYDILGLKFPEDAELLTGHSEARQYFLFSFLMDIGECIQDFITMKNE